MGTTSGFSGPGRGQSGYEHQIKTQDIFEQQVRNEENHIRDGN
jgi:hypothetical protein